MINQHLTNILLINILYFTEPERPQLVECVDITDMSIKISWTPPGSPNGDIQHYVIVTTDNQGFMSTNTTIGSEQTFTLTSLHPGNMYYMQTQ